MSSTTILPLSKPSTREVCGFQHVWDEIGPHTPYGAKLKKQFRPYRPGSEEELKKHFEDMDQLRLRICGNQQKVNEILSDMCELKEISLSLQRCKQDTLSIVELFTIKGFLVHSRKVRKTLEGALHIVPERYALKDTDALLDVMDPSGEYMDTFFIYDSFSEELAALRRENREIEAEIRRAKKGIRERLQAEHNFMMTPKFELIVPRADKKLTELAESLPELEKSGEDYMSVTFVIRANDEIFGIEARKSELEGKIEEEELKVCEWLSERIAEHAEELEANCDTVAKLDLDLAKCLYAESNECSKPVLCEEHKIAIEDGRNLQVEQVLKAQGRKYCPVSVELSDGVTAITGANMGGKTITLKMITQTALLTQYAMYVPCKKAEIGLSDYVHVLIGDSQNVQRGLSSFGSEMEELKEILDNARDRSLIMIDEIASGTNPSEGLALTRGFIDYFEDKPFITIVTTHFDHAAVGSHVKNLQVAGLSGADFDKLQRELWSANRRERIEIIGKYMDYRLVSTEAGAKAPREALKIAKILGVYDEIIDAARNYLL